MPHQRNRSYGAPMGTEDPIDEGRPQAGEADDATRSAMLKQRMSEKQPASTSTAESSNAATEKDSAGRPVHHDTDINSFNPVTNIRKGKKRIDDAIEDDSK